MKKIVVAIMVITVPLFLFIEVWQGSRFQTLLDTVGKMDAEQMNWLDKNQSMIAGIAKASSPETIEERARKELGLVKADPSKITRIILAQEGAPRRE